MMLRNYGMFAGIGGMELGLHRAGIQTVAFAETDPYASRVLAARFPGVPNLGDVTEADPPAGVNFISAGFPCQDISNAGLRAGITGSRSGLIWEVVRSIRLVRPLGALLENVAALLNRGMGTVLGALAALGYDAEWDCIPASALGAPHQRDRIWIVAYPDEDGLQERKHVAGIGEGSAGSKLSGCAPNRISASPGAPNAHEGQLSLGGTFGRVGRLLKSISGNRDWPITAEPVLGRGADGIPNRVDRCGALGNAVVPQIPELIGRAILASLTEQRRAA